ncbi:hypothetical protein [Jiangella rhizosphaerae]|uniref:Uncharacterized protein n=1 Tax=Jiangella rhizosphaerae TaxID=2293569 RepID=A0A418KIH4_9ACTN|nr:hypothetical protein [Jiangella rhizosphaerae]RIQ13240.1 hypothetical protein DY240_26180 [Jiangella rhizosphaerae]
MTASETTTIKVRKSTRERLSDVARRYGKTMDETLDSLLIEHDHQVRERTRQALADEAFMARIREARAEPMSESTRHSDVLAKFDKAGEDA